MATVSASDVYKRQTVYAWEREWHDWMSQKSIDACIIWDKNYEDTLTYPQAAILDTDESAAFSAIMGDINTYVSEKTTKFLTGGFTDAEYNEMIAQINKMRIDEAIELKKIAMDRYNNR